MCWVDLDPFLISPFEDYIMKDVYYLGTGEKTMMYTLRVQWFEKVMFEGEHVTLERDSYIQNLSTNKHSAVQKAAEMGYTIELPLFDLEEIRRNDAEKIVRLREERELKEETERIAKEDALISIIKLGKFPFGKFREQNFEEADTSYIIYWLKSDPQDSVTRSLVSMLRVKFKNLVKILDMKANGEYFGNPKTRYQNIKGTIIEKFSFMGFYGWNTVMKVISETGELLVYKGAGNLEMPNGDYPEIGDIITFAGTVKEHSQWKDENQTMVQRVKLKLIEG